MKPHRLPDVVNREIPGPFTQIPNTILRGSSLTLKAKGILFILFSNKTGWISSLSFLVEMLKEGMATINSGLKELEVHGHLCRVQCRDKKTKYVVSSFWVVTYTPWKFIIPREVIGNLTEKGWEIGSKDIEILSKMSTGKPISRKPISRKPISRKPISRKPISRKHKTNNIIYNNTNDKNIYLSEGRDGDIKNENTSVLLSNGEAKQSKSTESSKQVNNPKTKFIHSLAQQLAEIIQTKKRMQHTPSQIKNWTKEINKLITTHKVSPKRIGQALDWYKDHIGNPYVPVIESGSSLRSKFLKLEDAINRSTDQGYSAPKSHSHQGLATPEKGDTASEYDQGNTDFKLF